MRKKNVLRIARKKNVLRIAIVLTRKPRKNWTGFQGGRSKYFLVVDIKRYKRMSIFSYLHQIRWARGMIYNAFGPMATLGHVFFDRKRRKMINNDNLSQHYYNTMK